ncbi:MAG: YgiT-type zinc finger protein [Candidatus Odinarchaeota archaeon]
MARCVTCERYLKEVKGNIQFTLDYQTIVIDNVWIIRCEKCNEVYLKYATDKRVEELIKKYIEGEIVPHYEAQGMKWLKM